MIQNLQTSPYNQTMNFIHTQNSPDNLVILCKPEQVIKMMFQESLIEIVWVASDKQSKDFNFEIAQYQLGFKSRIRFVTSIQKCYKIVNESKKEDVNVIVSLFSDVSESGKLQALVSHSKITNFFIESFGPQSEKTQDNLIFKLIQKYSKSYQIIASIEDLDNAMTYLQKQEKSQFKQFPTFDLVQDSNENHLIIINTMLAMKNQKIDLEGRKLIVNELEKLFLEISNNSKYFLGYEKFTNKFIQQLKRGFLSVKQAIYWYTHESPIFKFINNLLRMSRDCTQMFYIQPFFKDVYSAISQLHKQQQKKKIFQNFVCYRGGEMNKRELKKIQRSVGKVVQNLGFLSTSLKKQEAVGFVKNVMMQIIVEKSENTEHGYAFIANLSNYFNEREILFNPLNSFKILQISQAIILGKQITNIKLKFGQVGRLMCEKLSFLKSQPSNFIQMIQFQYLKSQEIGQQIEFQGQIFVNDKSDLAMPYWQKFIKISSNNCCQCRFIVALMNLIDSKQIQNSIKQAIQICKLLFKQIELQFSCEHLNLKNLQIQLSIKQIKLYKLSSQYQISLKCCQQLLQKLQFCVSSYAIKRIQVNIFLQILAIKFLLKLYEQSIKYAQNVKETILQLFGFFSVQYAKYLNIVASIYALKGNYKEALKYHSDKLKIIYELRGENSYVYAQALVFEVNIHLRMSKNYQKSLQICKKALILIPSSCLLLYRLYELIAKTYFMLGKENMALGYAQQCQRGILLILTSPYAKIIYLARLGQMYLQFKQPVKVFYIFYKCKDIVQRKNTKIIVQYLQLALITISALFQLNLDKKAEQLLEYFHEKYEGNSFSAQIRRQLLQMLIFVHVTQKSFSKIISKSSWYNKNILKNIFHKKQQSTTRVQNNKALFFFRYVSVNYQAGIIKQFQYQSKRLFQFHENSQYDDVRQNQLHAKMAFNVILIHQFEGQYAKELKLLYKYCKIYQSFDKYFYFELWLLYIQAKIYSLYLNQLYHKSMSMARYLLKYTNHNLNNYGNNLQNVQQLCQQYLQLSRKQLKSAKGRIKKLQNLCFFQY